MADVVTDTFTASNNTDIESHVGEVGATWTRDSSFGQGNGGGRTFGIFSNALRRLTFAEQPGADGGESLIRPSGLLPGGTTRFTIRFSAKWDNTTDFGYIAVYEQAVNPGNSFFIFLIGNQDIEYADGGTQTVGFVPTAAQWYDVRLEIDGADLELFVDDVSRASWSRASQPAEPFGFDFFDFSSTGGTWMDNLRIYPSAPPGPFWTEYVKTTETIA